MQITTRYWVVGGIGFVIAVIAAAFYLKASPPPVVTPDTASSTPPAVVTGTTTPSVSRGPFPINSADKIASWSFKGIYAGNDTLIAQATADITHLTSLVGKGEYDDYDLYLGLGNDKSSLGDGASAYQNYNKSISIHPQKGLAYANLAYLFDQLGAYYSAADAYAKATVVEPRVIEYHTQRLKYLTRQFPSDTARITAALSDASEVFGDTASILAIEAEWLTGLKRYAEAITAWERAKLLSPGKDTSAIDTEIARLKAKL